MNLIDSHCHPQFPQYEADREEVIKRTLAAGCGMVCVGTDLEMSKRAIELAEKYPPCLLRRSDRFGCEGRAPDGFGRTGVWATVGSHPNCTTCDVVQLGELARHPKVVAIGEIGLDYYRTPEKEKQERQKEVFRQFLGLAAKHNKPLILHCRDAYEDMLNILGGLNRFDKSNRSAGHFARQNVLGVIHSFTGDFDLARKFLDLGLYLGLNGIITFTDEYNDMVAKIPLDRVLIETDAPYLAPVPYRGKRNEPLYVEFVARRIAEIKKISFEEVVEKTEENTKKLFKLE